MKSNYMGLQGFHQGTKSCPATLLMDDAQGGVNDSSMNASPTVDIDAENPKNVYTTNPVHVQSEANLLVEG
jgi:hypothetical protein